MKHVTSSPSSLQSENLSEQEPVTKLVNICEVIGLFEPVDKPLTVSDAERGGGVKVLVINNLIIIRLEEASPLRERENERTYPKREYET